MNTNHDGLQLWVTRTLLALTLWLGASSVLPGESLAGYYPVHRIATKDGSSTRPVTVLNTSDGFQILITSRQLAWIAEDLGENRAEGTRPYLVLAADGTARLKGQSRVRIKRISESFNVDFLFEGNGTWSGSGGTISLNIPLTASYSGWFEYRSNIGDTSDINSYYIKEEIEGAGLQYTINTDAKVTEAGGIEFSIPNPYQTWLPPIISAHLQGVKHSAVDAFTRPAGTEIDFQDPEGPYAYYQKFIWGGAGELKPTVFEFLPLEQDDGLRPNYGCTHLIGVDAPHGFVAEGIWGSDSGVDSVMFNYGGESFEATVDDFMAEAPDFDYGLAADEIQAEIRAGGLTLDTITRSLNKVSVPAWAGGPGDFLATPLDFEDEDRPNTMEYRAALDWPISMEVTTTLENASIFTGLLGFTGSAESETQVIALGDATPTPGNMRAELEFTIGEKELELTIGGAHTTVLTPNGMELGGEYFTNPFNSAFEKHVGLVSLIPGAAAVLDVLPFGLGSLISEGVGIRVHGQIGVTGSGDYGAETTDSSLAFTSGTLGVGAAVGAQFHAIPKFARGIVNLSIGGGGGINLTIDIFPNPAVSDVQGYLQFTMEATVFGLGLDVDHTWNFGSGAESMGFGNFGLASLDTQSSGTGLSTLESPLIFAADEVPPGADVSLEVVGGFFGPVVAAYADAHTTLPAPASQIVVRRYQSGTEWKTYVNEDNSGRSNFSPSIAIPPTGLYEGMIGLGIVVWCRTTAEEAPEDWSGLDDYMNSSELVFQYFLNGSFADGWRQVPRPLTDNAHADFGPELVRSASDGKLRLFWMRGAGMDLTGSATPITLMNRNLYQYDWNNPFVDLTADPVEMFTPEVAVWSGLENVVDWRAAAWDDENSAIVAVRDMDGDLGTRGDTEIWMVRQIDGIWGAPVRLTDNALADDAPVVAFSDASTVTVGWRQGDGVVGTFDVDALIVASDAPDEWFAASTGHAEQWNDVQLDYNPSLGGFAAYWSQDGTLFRAVQNTSPGGEAWLDATPAWASGVPGTISHFRVRPGTSTIGSVTQRSAGKSLLEAPETLGAKLQYWSFFPAGTTEPLWHYSTIDQNAVQPVGGSAAFFVGGPPGSNYTYTWTKSTGSGQTTLPASGGSLVLDDLDYDDEGSYSVSIFNEDGSYVAGNTFHIEMYEKSFASYMARHGVMGPNSGPGDDFDGDTVSNLEEYAAGTDPGDPASFPKLDIATVDSLGWLLMTTMVNQDWTPDLERSVEFSVNLTDWYDLSWLFVPSWDPSIMSDVLFLPTRDEDPYGEFLNQDVGTVEDGLFIRHGVKLVE